jgi:hypothetical protein
MLTLDSILGVAKMNGQYGPSEDSFSPRWHEKNLAPRPEAASVPDTTSRPIRLRIRYIIFESGDMGLHTGGPLPPGAKFVDDLESEAKKENATA